MMARRPKKITAYPGACSAAVFLLLGTLLLLAPAVSAGQESATAPGTPTNDTGTETTLRNQDVETILLSTTGFLARLPAFGVTIRSSYDAIQPDGQRIEFGEIRKILLQRPDRLRVEALRSDGDQNLVLFDGQLITAYKAGDNVFARVAQPGTVDDAVIYLVRDLQVRLPLARLLLSSLKEELQQQVEAVRYVEENVLYEEPVDHLAFRTAAVDAQLWVMQGDQPLPRRIVITYRDDPGQPQFRADFLDWDINPEIKRDSFLFSPPEGAEEILFLAPVPQQVLPVERGGQP